MKSRFNINPYCDLEKSLYDLNNDNSKKKTHWFSIDEKERQIFYKQKEHIDESRFVDGDIAEIHDLLKSDCRIINSFLIHYYAFDSEKIYKYYNRNLIRNQGLIKKDQNIYCDFSTSVTIYSSSSRHNTNELISPNKMNLLQKCHRHQG